MEYASFYGGRKGTSFIIVQYYPDIPSMVQSFSQGDAYTTVNYDEYVIINTVNKNHPDNGKIFRRGYDYNSNRTIGAYRAYTDNTKAEEIIGGTEEQYQTAFYDYDEEYPAGGAIYVGNIVGPAGRAPQLSIKTYALVELDAETEGIDRQASYGDYLFKYNNNNPMQVSDDSDLVPGKYTSGSSTLYNDTIKWYCYSVRDINNDDAYAYMGFKIPFPIIDFETEAIDPYSGTSYADTTAATRIDDYTHPFYEKWKLSIPKGVQGDTLKNFRIITPESTDVIYTVNTTTQYPGFDDDVTNHRQILVYDYYHYDNNSSGEPVTYYLGDYNQITDFAIAENGTVTIEFSHNNTIVYNQLIKYITNAAFVNNDINNACTLVLTYNTGLYNDNEEWVADTDTFELDWVHNITVDNDGSVNIYHTTDNNYENGINTLNQLIRWVNSVTLTSSGETLGYFAMTFNNGADLIANLHWVNNISVANNGQLTLHYSKGQDSSYADRIVPEVLLKWIDHISCDPYGIVTITYNTETNGLKNTLNVTGTETTPALRWINSIELNPKGELSVTYNTRTLVNGSYVTDKQTFANKIKYIDNINFENNGTVEVTYNTETVAGTKDKSTFTNLIKWIEDAKVENGEFQIKYNYKDYETDTWDLLTTLKFINDITLSKDGTITLKYNTTTNNVIDTKVLSQKMKWIDSITFNNGTLKVLYNNNTEADVITGVNWISNISLSDTGNFTVTYNNSSSSGYSTNLKWPVSLSINTDSYNNNDEPQGEGTGNQKVHVTYTPDYQGQARTADIGAPLNYIMDAQITPDDHHLIVLYSDPEKRTALETDNRKYPGTIIDPKGHADWNWLDLGSVVSDRDGVLVGMNLSWDTIYDGNVPQSVQIDDAIEYLNTTYPIGLTGTFLKDKIVTVGDNDENKFFFGFDYNYTADLENPTFLGWYSIGQLAPSDATISAILQTETGSIPSTLPQGSLWFVIEDIFSVTYNLLNVTSSNTIQTIKGGNTYLTSLTPIDGYTIQSVTVTMGGTDITNLVYNATNKTIRINNSSTGATSVTGNLVINATAIEG